MAKKQTQELRSKVLAMFPKHSKMKHYRSGGFNNQWTYVDILSGSGTVIASKRGLNLESALRLILGETGPFEPGAGE